MANVFRTSPGSDSEQTRVAAVAGEWLLLETEVLGERGVACGGDQTGCLSGLCSVGWSSSLPALLLLLVMSSLEEA